MRGRWSRRRRSWGFKRGSDGTPLPRVLNWQPSCIRLPSPYFRAVFPTWQKRGSVAIGFSQRNTIWIRLKAMHTGANGLHNLHAPAGQPNGKPVRLGERHCKLHDASKNFAVYFGYHISVQNPIRAFQIKYGVCFGDMRGITQVCRQRVARMGSHVLLPGFPRVKHGIGKFPQCGAVEKCIR